MQPILAQEKRYPNKAATGHCVRDYGGRWRFIASSLGHMLCHWTIKQFDFIWCIVAEQDTTFDIFLTTKTAYTGNGVALHRGGDVAMTVAVAVAVELDTGAAAVEQQSENQAYPFR